ncbi:MAG TPA: hypothetical protein VFY93_12450 [Planctomycetota bacterium]|nr:hypothetical protein [Planctomycetota bacterium]
MRIVGFLPLLFLVLLLVACGGSGRPMGPPAPVIDTIRAFEGHVGYYVTGPRMSMRDAAGRLVPETGFVAPNLPRNGPRFTVDVLDANGQLLGSTTTDSKGNYTVTVNFGQNPAEPVRVRTVARATIAGGTDLRVLPGLSSADPYEVVSPLTTDPDLRTTRIDLNVPLETAGAFHILEVLFTGLSAIRGGVTGEVPDLDVLWEPGNGAVSSFSDAGPHLGRIFVAGGITGNDASNQDAWDDPRLARLLGEYFLAYFSNAVAPAGTPDDTLLVPSAAWREGFLDFFSCAVRGTPEYWETEGIGAAGHVVRFFNAESFFDPALGSLGPDDPNVYQDPGVVGIGSRFTTTEVLWDIFDGSGLDADSDDITVPLFLMLGDLEALRPGNSYPYIYSALDEYVANQSFSTVQAEVLLTFPESHNLGYPVDDTTEWPTPIRDPLRPDDTVVPTYDETFSDVIDTASPGANPEIGLFAQRYFEIHIAGQATLLVTVTSAASLRVEILDLENNIVSAGTGTAATVTPGGDYVIRVLPTSSPVTAPFDLRVQLTP